MILGKSIVYSRYSKSRLSFPQSSYALLDTLVVLKSIVVHTSSLARFETYSSFSTI